MKYCFLVARPRSGTTALRDVLTNCSAVHAVGEIFTDNDKMNPMPFIYWAANVMQTRADLLIPNGHARNELLKGYIDYVGAKGGPNQSNCALVTVNYNSLHMLNTIWQNVFDAPYICTLIRQNGYGVIHLIRRNLLKALISEQRARESNVWHRKSGAATDSIEGAELHKVTVRTDSILRELTKRKWEIELISEFFHGYRHLKTLYYEDIFTLDDQPANEQFLEILKFLELDRTGPIKTTYMRTSAGTLDNEVTNWAEVCAKLKDTEFDWMTR